MSGAQDILMPQLGQAMTRGTVVEWCAASGDVVTAGSHLLTIESDKFTYEIETPSTGILHRLIDIGHETDIGTVLGRIGEAGSAPVATRPVEPAPSRDAAPVAAPERTDRPAASPKARGAAAGRIALADVPVSRRDGLIVAADVERAIAASPRETGGAIGRLQRSWQQAPHFVQMIDVDATALIDARRLHKAGAFPATLNDIVIWAAADALMKFPAINAHIRDGRPVRNATIDISLAVATHRGLRTPAVRDAGGRSIAWVAERSRAAIAAAASGPGPGGPASLTISNLGSYGIRQGTPVLNLDEAVLIFVGAIEDRAHVSNGAIVARPEMTLSIAFDHRVVDGLEAARFTGCLRDQLEGLNLDAWRAENVGTVHSRSVTLRSDDGLRCDLAAGGHRWAIDEPRAIGGGDAAADPVRQMLGALLSCLTIAVKLVAARRNVPIDRVTGAVTATPTGKIRAIDLRLDIWSAAAPDAVQALLKPAKAACTVHDMLREDVTVTVELIAHPTQVPA